MLHQRLNKGIERRAATRGKVAWRAGRIIVPATPTFAIATSGGDPARNNAERVHHHGRLTLRTQIKPGVQIGPVVAVIASAKEAPFGSRLPQAHRPRLRLGRNPRAIQAAVVAPIDTLKAPICRLYGMTPH